MCLDLACVREKHLDRPWVVQCAWNFMRGSLCKGPVATTTGRCSRLTKTPLSAILVRIVRFFAFSGGLCLTFSRSVRTGLQLGMR